MIVKRPKSEDEDRKLSLTRTSTLSLSDDEFAGESDDYQLTIKNPYNHEGNGESDDDYYKRWSEFRLIMKIL